MLRVTNADSKKKKKKKSVESESAGRKARGDPLCLLSTQTNNTGVTYRSLPFSQLATQPSPCCDIPSCLYSGHCSGMQQPDDDTLKW
jgi:hypothetical protein